MISGGLNSKEKQTDYGTGIPRHEVETLARILLPEIQRYFESEEGRMEFEEWRMTLTNINI